MGRIGKHDRNEMLLQLLADRESAFDSLRKFPPFPFSLYHRLPKQITIKVKFL